MPPRGGSANFGDSQEAVTPVGAASGTARRSPRRGVGGACRAGRAGAGAAAEREGGCEAGLPPFVRRSASDRGGGPGNPVRRARRGRRGRGEAGGGARHTWPRSRATCLGLARWWEAGERRRVARGARRAAGGELRALCRRSLPSEGAAHPHPGAGTALASQAPPKGAVMGAGAAGQLVLRLCGWQLPSFGRCSPVGFASAGVFSFSPVEFTASCLVWRRPKPSLLGIMQVF